MRRTDLEAITTMSAELEIISNDISRQSDLMKKGLTFNMHLDYFFDENSHFPEGLMRKEILESMPGYKKLIDVCKANNVCLEMLLDKPADTQGQAPGSVSALFYKTYADSSVFVQGQCIWTATAGAAPAKPTKPRPMNGPDDFGGFID